MRIAYVVSTYPLPSQTFIVNEMIEVQEAGHEIVAVPLYLAAHSSVRNETFERLRPVAILPTPLFNFTVACLALWMLFTHPLRVMGTLISLHWASGLNPYAHASLILITPKALATAWRLRQANVDRIHAHFATHTATCAGIAGSVSGIPFSFTAHAYDIYCTTPKLRNDTLGWKLSRAIQVFTVCEYAANLLRQRLPAADGNRIQTVYVGIPMHLFCEEPPPPRDGGLRLLCVAHFYEKKGLDTLLDACALLRDQGLPFRLLLYGDGPLREALAEQIARLGLGDHVTFGGIISQEEVAWQMRACHLLVMPCRQDRNGDMDGIPTAFMEAMAVGRPVISCPISGIPELVRHGETGLLVVPNNPSALAAAVMRLASDNALCIRLGQQARALVERQHDQRLNVCYLLELMTHVSLSVAAHQRTQKTLKGISSDSRGA
jgi:colanic acid/amylovoran biosynthesis glycosyltransferase